jgi:hypothetical protein
MRDEGWGMKFKAKTPLSALRPPPFSFSLFSLSASFTKRQGFLTKNSRISGAKMLLR